MSNERLAISTADVSDLDASGVDAFIARRALGLVAELGRDEAAHRLGIYAKVGTRYAPTLVGLYTFGRLPQLHFPEWGVSCAAFHGTHLTDDVTTRRDVEGGLVALVEGTLAFVREQSGGGLGHEAEYGETALREAIVNAIVHRDLRKPSRVAVRVFTDRIEVWSPGGPPEGLTDLEELAREGGISNPRSPLLASFARTLGLTEQIGRGLALLVQTVPPSLERRVEIRVTARDVLVVVPSRWQRPRAALS